MSKSSERPNNPRVKVAIDKPSNRNTQSKVNRYTPVDASKPIIAINTPRAPLATPFFTDSPVRVAINDNPSNTSMAISGVLKAISIGSSSGIITRQRRIGMAPPAIDAITAAPIARLPSPF